MPPKKRNKTSRASRKGQRSQAANDNLVQQSPSTSSNREELQPTRPSGILNELNRPPSFQVPSENNEPRIQEIAQSTAGPRTTPHVNNLAYDSAPTVRGAEGHTSQREYERLFLSRNSRPSNPGRPVSHLYGDARDYLTREQYEAVAGTSDPRADPNVRPDRGQFPYSSQYTRALYPDLPDGHISYGHSNGHYPGENPINPGTANNTARSQAASNPYIVRTGYMASPLPSTARLNQFINDVQDTPTPRERRSNDRARTLQPPKTQRTRKFSERDSSSPTPNAKRGRRTEIEIEDITDQPEETRRDLAISNETYSDDCPSRFPMRDLIHGTGSYSRRPSMADAATINPTPSLSDPFMGHVDDEAIDENPPMAPPRTGVILLDNYNIFNPSLIARVAAECRRGRYRNTPQAIATYHQLAMADDLFYNGIWRGRFLVNEGHIFEYHNPAPCRPRVDDSQRTDRRLLMAQVRGEDGETVWQAVSHGNALSSADGRMQAPPADFQDTLDLMRYFFQRVSSVPGVPTLPSIDRYAQLVAPLYVDRSEEAANENMRLLGVGPGSNPANAALRPATPTEIDSQEGREAVRYIPTVPYGSQDLTATGASTAPLAPINDNMAPSAFLAPLPPVGVGMASNTTGFGNAYLGSLPSAGANSSASATPYGFANSGMGSSNMANLAPGSLGPFPGPGMNSTASSTYNVTFPPPDAYTTQDTTGFEFTTLSAYPDQAMVPYDPSTSLQTGSFENTTAAVDTTYPSYPAYPSVSQDPATLSTSAVTATGLPAPMDILLGTNTVPTTLAQPDPINVDTTSVPAAPPFVNASTTSVPTAYDPNYMESAPYPDPGMNQNTTGMPMASLAPVGDSTGLGIENANPGDPNIPNPSPVLQDWLNRPHQAPGSVDLENDNQGVPPNPSNLDRAIDDCVASLNATGGSFFDAALGTGNQFNDNNQAGGVGHQFDNDNQLGGIGSQFGNDNQLGASNLLNDGDAFNSNPVDGAEQPVDNDQPVSDDQSVSDDQASNSSEPVNRSPINEDDSSSVVRYKYLYEDGLSHLSPQTDDPSNSEYVETTDDEPDDAEYEEIDGILFR